MHPTPIPARIAALRAAMQQHRLDAYIVPSADPHLSEYLPARWQGRQWLSGFNGSVGTLIVTAEKAGVWVDSRYWTQAEAELAGSGIELMKIAAASSTDHISWLAEQIPAGGRVGADGAVLGLAHARLLEQHLGPRGIVLDTRADLLDAVWPERESLPTAAIYAHSSRFAPSTRAEKLAQVRAEMHRLGAQWHFISTLDDLAWVFNLRGADVNYNPVFLGHALIGPDRAELFVAPGKIDAALSSQLGADGIAIRPYTEAAQALAALPGDASLLLDPRRVTLGFRQAVADSVKVVEAVNPSTFAKSRKTADEAAFIRQAMEQDGAALCEFFSWLETALEHGETVTELTIDEQITAARARRADFVSPSFSTIAGFRGNGAMPHYRATPESHSLIEGDGLLLIDSGAQYYGGTTDITRMVAVGRLSDEQRRDCSLVLKGVIALSTLHFPKGVRSPMLDSIARAPIWAAGIDYGHGTGHGVGYFLNVHEGPQVIGPSAMPEPHTAMEIGMITSVEPGIYRPGQWGVRIENLVLNVPHETTRFGEFLAFETLTLCPIDTRCLDLALLRPDEIAWLNAYHAEVKRRVTPYVDGAALAWLEKRTAAV